MPTNPNPSPLSDLSNEQQDQLLAWLELFPIKQVLEKVAAPAPEGFGIKTYPTTLRRFYARRRAGNSREDSQLATELVDTTDPAPQVDSAIALGVRQIAFELSNSPRIGPKQFKALSRWVLKLRDQEHAEKEFALARERLALDRERFQFNAARQALLHHDKLGEIMKDDNTDDEDKINAARRALFGSDRELPK
ncbi:MAG TPA: hypothetical protein VF773_12375 [Verrucomicrobiae bacterium]